MISGSPAVPALDAKFRASCTAGCRATATALSTDGPAVFQYWRDGRCAENFEPDVDQPPSAEPGPWQDRVMALVLDHLGLTLDDVTLAAPWPTLTVAEDDAPTAPRGDVYAGEGPVPPGAVEIL